MKGKIIFLIAILGLSMCGFLDHIEMLLILSLLLIYHYYSVDNGKDNTDSKDASDASDVSDATDATDDESNDSTKSYVETTVPKDPIMYVDKDLVNSALMESMSMNPTHASSFKQALRKLDTNNRQEDINTFTDTTDRYNNDDFDLHFDINDSNSIKHNHASMGCSGDNALANRMKYSAMQSQLATVNRASYNKHSIAPYLEEEFRNNETRDWWEADHLDQYM